MRDVDQQPTPDAAGTPANELRGSVVDVVRALREENDWDAVLQIVGELVAKNADMTRQLAQVKRSFKTSEKVGRAQLVLFVDALARREAGPEADEAEANGPDEIDEADAMLRVASGIARK